MSGTDAAKHNTVLVVDYGVGNHQSVTNALQFLGYSYSVSFRKEDIQDAQSYILPGVGAFREAMTNLKKRGIIDALAKEVLERKKPILGLCLGMQVLAADSVENGIHAGLGWIPGHVVRIPSDGTLRVPHVGWNQVVVHKIQPLFSSIPKGSRFYFDHSYYFQTDKKYVAATSSYGTDITAAVQHENIFGLQFHPEKSQTNGLRLLRAFFEHVAKQKPATKKK